MVPYLDARWRIKSIQLSLSESFFNFKGGGGAGVLFLSTKCLLSLIEYLCFAIEDKG